MSALNVAEEMSVALPERAVVQESSTRPFLWSVRRELWENPSIVVAPLAVAAVEVLSSLIATGRFGKTLLSSASGGDGQAVLFLALPFVFIAIALVVTMILVAVFYSLDALHSERRDRSIFFWKSLPVSDRTTVLAKIAVPMVVLPVATFVVAIAAQLLILLLGSVVLLAEGASINLLWAHLPLPSLWTALAYGLVTTTLWYAPIYAWFMLISAWVKRAALIWAVIPLLLLALFEKIAFSTHYVVDLLKYRIGGLFPVAFAPVPPTSNAQIMIPLSALTPAHFLASLGLWTGLVFAVVVLLIVVRMRRYREPI
jgi:ABC-2 type transport system permease protein